MSELDELEEIAENNKMRYNKLNKRGATNTKFKTASVSTFNVKVPLWRKQLAGIKGKKLK